MNVKIIPDIANLNGAASGTMTFQDAANDRSLHRAKGDWISDVVRARCCRKVAAKLHPPLTRAKGEKSAKFKDRQRQREESLRSTAAELEELLLATLDRLQREAAEAEQADAEGAAGGSPNDGGENGDEEKEKFTQAQALVGLAEGVELFHNDDVPFATFDVLSDDGNSHRETHPLNAKGFRSWLARKYWLTFAKVPGAQATQDALCVLTGKAIHDGRQAPTFSRLAEHEGAVYLDLCDAQWRAVRVTAAGWELVRCPPVKFIRRRGMLPLPEPMRGGSLDELRPLVNAGDDATWRLVVAWLLGTLHPRGPYALLTVNGEQGSAKSTLCRALRRLVDPNKADLRAAPRDERDLAIAANNSWLVAFDNLSGVPEALADAMCRLATGQGFGTRELYSDDEEKLFDAKRPILLNGIEELATRPDLMDRAVSVNLPTIAEEDRRAEADVWEDFERVRPRVLGALLDAVVEALKNLPHVELERLPRMADFAKWVVAAELALPWPAGGFMKAYDDCRDAAIDLAIEASAIGPPILKLLDAQPQWGGTAAELLAALGDPHTDQKTRDRKDWPRTPKAISGALRRLAPALRQAKHGVTFGKRSRCGTSILLERVGQRPSQRTQRTPTLASATESGFRGDDRVTVGDGQPVEPSPNRHPENRVFDPENRDGDGCDGCDGVFPTRSKDEAPADTEVIEL